MFDKKVATQHPDGFGKRSLEDVVIMASMIVREEPTEKHRPMVAGILWKRIDNEHLSAWMQRVDTRFPSGTTAEPSSRSCGIPSSLQHTPAPRPPADGHR